VIVRSLYCCTNHAELPAALWHNVFQQLVTVVMSCQFVALLDWCQVIFKADKRWHLDVDICDRLLFLSWPAVCMNFFSSWIVSDWDVFFWLLIMTRETDLIFSHIYTVFRKKEHLMFSHIGHRKVNQFAWKLQTNYTRAMLILFIWK